MSQVSIADCNILKYSLLGQCVRSCVLTYRYLRAWCWENHYYALHVTV